MLFLAFSKVGKRKQALEEMTEWEMAGEKGEEEEWVQRHEEMAEEEVAEGRGGGSRRPK